MVVLRGSIFLILMGMFYFILSGSIAESVNAEEPHKIQITAIDKTVKVAKEKTYEAWTYEGFIPGPVIRVKEGDEIELSFKNEGANPHSVVFHGIKTSPNQHFINVGPLETSHFTWKAHRSGVFLYHCQTPPAVQHIANGMYGILIVDPKEPREKAREIVLVQSEIYASHRDVHGMLNRESKYVVFNGYANKYVETPLEGKPGELIRFYVVNAGPNYISSFGIEGAEFQKIYENGNPEHLKENFSFFPLPPGSGAIFEITLMEEGLYPFKTHALADSYRGAMGFLRISKNSGLPQALMP